MARPTFYPRYMLSDESADIMRCASSRSMSWAPNGDVPAEHAISGAGKAAAAAQERAGPAW